MLADYAFTPLLLDGGALAGSVGRIFGTGGKGTGFLIFVAGALLCAASAILYNLKPTKKLENRGG